MVQEKIAPFLLLDAVGGSGAEPLFIRAVEGGIIGKAARRARILCVFSAPQERTSVVEALFKNVFFDADTEALLENVTKRGYRAMESF